MFNQKRNEEIEAENARTLHFALTPFRLLYQVLAWLGLVGMIIAWFFVRHTGWVIGIGPRGEWARQDIVDQLSRNVGANDVSSPKMIDITVEFGARAGGTYTWEGGYEETWRQPDHFWVTERSNYVADPQYAYGMEQPEKVYRTMEPFILREHRASTSLQGFPYCHIGHPQIFQTALGPWSDREDPNHLIDRKSGRMRRDYETAAIMVSALRSALAHLKAGQNLDSEYGPASGKPLENSYCNADGADPAVLSQAQIETYRAATFDVHLGAAQDVVFRYLYASDDSRWNEGGMRIVGMCLDSGHDCDNDAGLMPYTTFYADLWATNPPLSPTQLRAERALLQTATWEFWVEKAQENGISDTRFLAKAFQGAQKDLAAIFGETPSR